MTDNKRNFVVGESDSDFYLIFLKDETRPMEITIEEYTDE